MHGQLTLRINSLEDIPDEVLIFLFMLLDPQKVARMSQVSKRMYSLSLDPLIWKILYQQFFGNRTQPTSRQSSAATPFKSEFITAYQQELQALPKKQRKIYGTLRFSKVQSTPQDIERLKKAYKTPLRISELMKLHPSTKQSLLNLAVAKQDFLMLTYFYGMIKMAFRQKFGGNFSFLQTNEAFELRLYLLYFAIVCQENGEELKKLLAIPRESNIFKAHHKDFFEIAVKANNLEGLRFLLDSAQERNGLRPEEVNPLIKSLISEAIVHGKTMLALSLISDIFDDPSFNIMDPLIQALSNNNPELSMLLLEDRYYQYASPFDLGQALSLATQKNYTVVAKKLIARGARSQYKNKGNVSPLHFAAQNGNMKLAILLLNQGAEIDLKDHQDFTPLMYAVSKNHLELVKHLITRSNRWKKNSDLMSIALGLEAPDAMLRLLLQHHPNALELPRLDGLMLIEFAAINNYYQGIETVLAYLEKTGTELKEFKTAFHLAVDQSHLKSIALFIKYGMDVNLKDQQGLTPLIKAISEGDLDLAKMLLAAGATVDLDTFLRAVKRNLPELIIILLEHNNTSDIVNAHGFRILKEAIDSDAGKALTPILQFFLTGKADILDWVMLKPKKIPATLKKLLDKHDDNLSLPKHAVKQKRLAILQQFLDYGANINIKDKDGRTLLHHAVKQGYIEVVSFLLERKAKILKDHRGRTPLHESTSLNQVDITRSLVDANADIHALDNNEISPFFLAAYHGRLKTMTLFLARAVYYSSLSYCTKQGTVFHMALQKPNNQAILKKLIGRLMPIDHPELVERLNQEGQTLLHVAVKRGNYPNFKLIMKHVKTTIINHPDSRGKRPLHYAVADQKIKMVRALLSAGAKVDLRDQEEKNCIAYLPETASQELQQVLIFAREEQLSPLYNFRLFIGMQPTFEHEPLNSDPSPK